MSWYNGHEPEGIDGPALRGIDGPALGGTDGPALRDTDRPALRGTEGSALRGTDGSAHLLIFIYTAMHISIHFLCAIHYMNIYIRYIYSKYDC